MPPPAATPTGADARNAMLDADRATADTLARVERLHPATDVHTFRQLRWVLLAGTLGIVAAGLVYAALLDPAVGAILIAGGLIAVPAEQWLLRYVVQRLITAVVVRRDALTALSHGRIDRDIAWADITGVAQLDGRRGWEVRVRHGQSLTLRPAFHDLDSLITRLRAVGGVA